MVNSMFGEVSRQSLDVNESVCFVMDEQLRLVYCNPAWDRFAEQNGAPQLRAENMMGAPVMDSISGDLAGYYEALYRGTLASGQPCAHEFHCSSAEVERLMKMQLYPWAQTLLVVCSLRIERPHSSPAGEPVESRYRNEDGIIVMCSHCRRTRRTAVEPSTWDWIPDFVSHMPPMVSHGVCEPCLEYYYPQSE